MIASFTQWQVFSIDPALQMDKYRDKISSLPNLKMYKQKAEDFEQFPKQYCPLSIVLAVHSHADLNEFWSRTPKYDESKKVYPIYPIEKVAVAIPCCKPQVIKDLKPVDTYIDLAIQTSGKKDSNLCKRGIAIWSI